VTSTAPLQGAKTSSGASATASTSNYVGAASADVEIGKVSLFGGLATANAVHVRVRARDGRTSRSGVVRGLVVDGRPVGTLRSGRTLPLGDYGRLEVLRPSGSGIVALRGKLSQDYEGYPAGSTVTYAYAAAAARNGVGPAPPTHSTPSAPPRKEPEPTQTTPHPPPPPARQRPRRHKAPSRLHVLATDRHFVFPVYGKHSIGNGFTGATRADLGPNCAGPHEGNDIFAPAGRPVLAVTGGTLESVGTKPCSGNRVWLKSDRGDTFFYAHLDSFAEITHNRARVKAGDVIGFLGNTGQATDRPSHLHFEIHPGGGLAIDPYPFLRAWETRRDVPAAAWVRENGQVGQQPGTLVVVRDFLSR
jgi:murein DD-endopeptidase MepM/ murein hydrolase activator NlpD